jgi:serine/threonine protein kinase
MENVLVMQTYDFSCRVVLTDFGFANHVDPKTLRMKSRVGTEGYVAP